MSPGEIRPKVMVRVENLNVFYGSQLALRDVSLAVEQGTITAIVGPSGCGKSSLLAALNRITDLIPGARMTGRVAVDGIDFSRNGASVIELRRRVGMIFQRPNPFPTSIRRNIQLALREHGTRDRRQLDEIAERVLEDVGLWEEVRHRLDRPAQELSGGQQQRLCLARALALEPQVLLMDEPCSALDPIASGHVESLILRLRERYTILIVTHNLAQARRISDRMAVLWFRDGSGEIVESGETQRVFESPSHPMAAAYLTGIRG